jgi:hypothetical protein
MASDSQGETPRSEDWWIGLTLDEEQHLALAFGPGWRADPVAKLYIETLRRIRAIEAEALGRLKKREP